MASLINVTCRDHEIRFELLGTSVDGKARTISGDVIVDEIEIGFLISIISRGRMLGVGIKVDRPDRSDMFSTPFEDYTNHERLAYGLREISEDVPASVRLLVIQHIDQLATSLREQFTATPTRLQKLRAWLFGSEETGK